MVNFLLIVLINKVMTQTILHRRRIKVGSKHGNSAKLHFS